MCILPRDKVMGLWSLYICHSFSAGIDYRRQILTSIVDSRNERIIILIISVISVCTVCENTVISCKLHCFPLHDLKRQWPCFIAILKLTELKMDFINHSSSRGGRWSKIKPNFWLNQFSSDFDKMLHALFSSRALTILKSSASFSWYFWS